MIKFLKDNWFKLAVLLVVIWVSSHLISYLDSNRYSNQNVSAEKILEKYGIR